MMLKDQLIAAKESLSSRVNLQQKAFFYVTCVGMCVGLIGFFWWSLTPKTSVEPSERRSRPENERKIRINGSFVSDRQKEIWVDKFEKERAVMGKQIQQLETTIKALVGAKLIEGGQGQAGNGEGVGGDGRPVNMPANTLSGVPQDDIGAIRQQMQNMQGSSEKSQPTTQAPLQNSGNLLSMGKKEKISKITFQLDQLNSHKINKSVDHYVPAGTFARGVLTNGVVAATTVSAGSNPQPVHIQLTDMGNLPRKFKSDLKRCFLIGAAYGDLASERVFMRLEKFSCVERKTGEVMEAAIDGYVSGEDGANGLRGYVVDRSGPAMRNAFVGGFVSGIGNFFAQQQNQPVALAGGLATMNPLTAKEMLQAGSAKGIGSAMDKFSDFYIKRAEQLQPVIEIEPGRQVDVVFKSGFDLNQTLYRRQLMVGRDKERRDIATSAHQSDQLHGQPVGQSIGQPY